MPSVLVAVVLHSAGLGWLPLGIFCEYSHDLKGHAGCAAQVTMLASHRNVAGVARSG